MKKTLLIISILFITNCTLNKVEKHHGSIFLEKKKDEIIINKFNKNDVKKTLGPPSTKSLFENDTWIYMESVKTNSKLSKLGKRSLVRNNILILEFNKFGIVTNKKYLTKDDINKIKFEEQITKVDYNKKSLVYKMLSGLKDKINDPLGSKRIKTSE
jgi:outer membrane protein assembly factor BamE (lipoprotein component of BamABCDE complex)